MLLALRAARWSGGPLRRLPCFARAAASAGGRGAFEQRASLYKRLGVGRGASLSEVKQAFYQKAKDCHPDLHAEDASAAAKFRELAEAYDVLSDPEARRKYDESGIDSDGGDSGAGAGARTWKPGDGWRAEDMEGNKRWREVMQDGEVVRQAREEYMAELRHDLRESCEAVLRGDASGLLSFARRHPGIVAGGLLCALPVLLAVRSPALVLLTLKRLAAVEALATKVIVSFMLPWSAAMGLDIPGKIWNLRVASARRALERRRAAAAERRKADAARPDGSGTGVGPDAGASADGQPRRASAVKEPALQAALATCSATASQLPEVSSGVPNVVYLDDSGSMIQFKTRPDSAFSLTAKYRWDKTCLQAGQKELIELSPYLEGTPTRVVKFGGLTVFEDYEDEQGTRTWITRQEMLRTLLLERSSFQHLLDLPPLVQAWDGSSQGTYMWKMIETDIIGTYQPGTPIRVHLITDGYDTHSPEPFRGIQGMDALKASLREKGYRIQWNIILLLFGAHSFHGLTAGRYEALCLSSGGVFKLVTDGYENHGGDAELGRFLAAHDAEAAGRRYRDLLLAARTTSGDEIELPRLSS